MNTPEQLKTRLVKRINSDAKAYGDNKVKQYLTDVTINGCISGMVNGLIYYDDTVKFYKAYKPLINEMLADVLQNECNNKFTELHYPFGNKWDTADPLALGEANQNLLAWFCYEEVVMEMLNELENA